MKNREKPFFDRHTGLGRYPVVEFSLKTGYKPSHFYAAIIIKKEIDKFCSNYPKTVQKEVEPILGRF